MKLKQKSRNGSRQPPMLHQARKYFNTQDHHMKKLDPHDVPESKNQNEII